MLGYLIKEIVHVQHHFRCRHDLAEVSFRSGGQNRRPQMLARNASFHRTVAIARNDKPAVRPVQVYFKCVMCVRFLDLCLDLQIRAIADSDAMLPEVLLTSPRMLAGKYLSSFIARSSYLLDATDPNQ